MAEASHNPGIAELKSWRGLLRSGKKMLAFATEARLNAEMSDEATPADDGSDDCMKPPAIPTEVHCLHCGEEYQSYLIEYRTHTDARGRNHGFWCCPTPGCSGAGFLFDIFPTDPEWRNEDGERVWFDDGDEDEFSGDEENSDSDFSDDPDDNWLPVAEEDDDTEWNEDFYEAMDAEEKRAKEERAARQDGTTADNTRSDALDDFNEDDIPF